MKIRFLFIVSVLAILTACGGAREIQQDGTGSDEMNRSPCVCNPVRYDPPSFTWGVG